MGLKAIEKLLAYLLVFKTPLNDIRLKDRFELAKPLQPEPTHKRQLAFMREERKERDGQEVADSPVSQHYLVGGDGQGLEKQQLGWKNGFCLQNAQFGLSESLKDMQCKISQVSSGPSLFALSSLRTKTFDYPIPGYLFIIHFPKWLHHFTFPSALCFSTSSTHLSFFHYRHPSGFIFKKLFIWPCCVFAAFVCIFSSCSEQGLLFIVVRGLLIVAASLAVQRRLQAAHMLSSCGVQAVSVQASVVAAYRLSSYGSQALECGLSGCGDRLVAPRHVESSQTRDRTYVPCIVRQISIPCTTREVPQWILICISLNWTWNKRLVPNRKRSISRLYIVTLLI